jgi:TonB-linked SusC/RagA family outer membrane protein
MLAFLLMAGMHVVYAQTTVSGTVTDDKGDPVPGANVRAKGYSDVGTISDLNGQYNLNVPDEVTTLVFSFVGMAPKEVEIAGQTVINVMLSSEDVGIEEVVVTAIGISREKKALGYAVSSVDNEEVTKSRDASVMNSLQGKIAGVRIQNGSGAPGSSTKVILRGYSSIAGGNQPLYIVDGVPINNSTNNFATGDNSLTRVTDFGNRANDINPEDVANVTILKGASATALYGSRAANGVIMITTKKGKQGDKLDVNFSTSVALSNAVRLPEYQNKFGQGWSGLWASEENGSWGPEFDGRDRVWGNVVNNSQQVKPFVYLEDNLKDFYETGYDFTNTFSVSGGNETATFYASYANVDRDGIVPTDADTYKRNTLTFNSSVKKGKFGAGFNVNYINRKSSQVYGGQGDASGGATLYQNIMQVPTDISIVDMEAGYKDDNSFNNTDNYYTPYTDNPYWIINENGNEAVENRVYGKIDLEYSFLDNLKVQWRLGADVANFQMSDWGAISKTNAGAPNNGVRTDIDGSVIERTRYAKEINSDFLVTYNTAFAEDFTLNAIAGYNVNDRYFENGYSRVTNLIVPEYYNLANSASTPEVANTVTQRRLIGVYGQADVSFKDFVYLTLTARNDWSSTLPKDKNSFFYPGVSLSFIANEAIPVLSDIFSIAKLRASWGQTGNDAAPYSLETVFIPGGVFMGFGNVNFPLGGYSGYEISNQLGNKDLKPEITTEYEFGVDLRFFDNRVGIDAAYYNRRTADQILAVAADPASGYSSQVRNIGEIENKGYELQLNIVPIRTQNFTWDLTWTYSNNQNKVIELVEGLEEVNLGGFIGMSIYAIPGQPMGVMKGTGMERSPSGNIVVDANGVPVASTEDQVFGNVQADYLMGFRTSLTYKGIVLSAAADYSKGGIMYSRTSADMNWSGGTVMSAYNNRQPWLIPGSVQKIDNPDGSVTFVENTVAMDNTQNRENYWGTYNEFDLYDKTFFRLREVTLGYTLPKSIMSKLPVQEINVSLYGRNLLLWTPESNNIIDPEMSSFGNDIASEFGEYATGPSVRTFGASLRVKF